MNIDTKVLKKIKVKLALQGSGSKSKLATEIGAYNSEISVMLQTGRISKKHIDKLNEWVK